MLYLHKALQVAVFVATLSQIIAMTDEEWWFSNEDFPAQDQVKDVYLQSVNTNNQHQQLPKNAPQHVPQHVPQPYGVQNHGNNIGGHAGSRQFQQQHNFGGSDAYNSHNSRPYQGHQQENHRQKLGQVRPIVPNYNPKSEYHNFGQGNWYQNENEHVKPPPPTTPPKNEYFNYFNPPSREQSEEYQKSWAFGEVPKSAPGNWHQDEHIRPPPTTTAPENEYFNYFNPPAREQSEEFQKNWAFGEVEHQPSPPPVHDRFKTRDFQAEHDGNNMHRNQIAPAKSYMSYDKFRPTYQEENPPQGRRDDMERAEELRIALHNYHNDAQKNYKFMEVDPNPRFHGKHLQHNEKKLEDNPTSSIDWLKFKSSSMSLLQRRRDLDIPVVLLVVICIIL